MTDAAPPAVVLLSGGLDSTTVLAIAAAAGQAIHALSFAYGQRHAVELECAARQARRFGARAHEVVDLAHMGRLVAPATALVASSHLEVPRGRDLEGDAATIPVTYVPARNTLFLAYALAWAEALGARDLWIGVNALDYSGYPDCRPEFIAAFERTANLATRAGVEGRGFTIHTPLIDLRKSEIIARGAALGVEYGDTVSCYAPTIAGDGRPLACGRCDSCQLRREGFAAAGIADPTAYVPG
ncbi:MAG: 7-cyano-7-deazaguanine synthase QueC [Myxococcales bacterium]|nr:7-cyano-7-deazaguanine synthase QueC [Myxococcales bacterium]